MSALAGVRVRNSNNIVNGRLVEQAGDYIAALKAEARKALGDGQLDAQLATIRVECQCSRIVQIATQNSQPDDVDVEMSGECFSL